MQVVHGKQPNGSKRISLDEILVVLDPARDVRVQELLMKCSMRKGFAVMEGDRTFFEDGSSSPSRVHRGVREDGELSCQPWAPHKDLSRNVRIKT